jgi:hypothetical protein
MSGDSTVFAAGFTPADFLDGIAGHVAAERLAHQLAAETVTYYRDVFRHCFANQGTNRGYPGQRIIDAHRPAHETQARKVVDRSRHRFTFIQRNQFPWNPLLLKEYGKITGTLSGRVTKDGNGFHVDRPDVKMEMNFTRLLFPAGDISITISGEKSCRIETMK